MKTKNKIFKYSQQLWTERFYDLYIYISFFYWFKKHIPFLYRSDLKKTKTNTLSYSLRQSNQYNCNIRYAGIFLVYCYERIKREKTNVVIASYRQPWKIIKIFFLIFNISPGANIDELFMITYCLFQKKL